jgi:catechol 2,3-dioxygenase-like lactoylglutathione lyase family enzyme
MTHAFQRLHHVQLAIPPGGEEVAREFYRDALGMRELEKPSALQARGGCWFRAGDVEVHLGVEEDFTPAKKAHPGVLVADLDTLAAKLLAVGRPVQWDEDFPGHRRFYSTDGHGNRLEFLQSM